MFKKLYDQILWAVGLENVYEYSHSNHVLSLYTSDSDRLYFYVDGKVTITNEEKSHTYNNIWEFIREVATSPVGNPYLEGANQ